MAAMDSTVGLAGVTAMSAGRRWILGGAFLVFLAGTALLYFVGPWQYPMAQEQGRLVLFLVGVHLALAIGYGVGIRSRPRRASRAIPVSTIVLAASLAELVLLWPTSYVNTGSWIPRLGTALDDLGAVYADTLARRETGTPIVNYVRMLVSPLLAAALPLAVFFWHALPRVTRAVFAASVAGTVALFIAMGANAGLAQWVALFPWFVLGGHLSGVQRLSRRTWIVAGAVLACSSAVFLVLFSGAMVQRGGSFVQRGLLPGVSAVLERGQGPADGDPPGTPGRFSVGVGFQGLAAYMTQGYHAVYLSLQEPFVPTWGVGNSVFLHRQMARLLGDETILAKTYPRRIEARGWNASVYWATIYPWLASDFTFPGVVLVMMGIGWIVGRVWVDVIGAANPLAVIFLGQLLLMLYYFPAHNKVMHSGEGVLAFWTWALLWWWLREPAHAR